MGVSKAYLHKGTGSMEHFLTRRQLATRVNSSRSVSPVHTQSGATRGPAIPHSLVMNDC